jgi:hypothetical protein
MLKKEKIKSSGKLHIVLRNKFGEVIEERYTTNLITTVGKEHIADQLSDQNESAMSHMAIGDDDTAPDVTDTTLGNELTRQAFDSRTLTDNEVEYKRKFLAGDGTGTIKEAGLLNAGAGGTLLAHTAISPAISKGASDTLEITWTLTIN